jgi:phage shock protein C
MSGDYKRLYRARDERMIAGVCGGVAKYFSVDPTLVRLLFALLTVPGGPGLVAYIVMAIIVPEEPVDQTEAPLSSPEPQEAAEVEAESPEPE